MRGESHIRMHFSRGIRHAKRVSPAEAVARDPDAGRTRCRSQVVDGCLEQGFDHLGAVLSNELRAVEVGVVQVRRRGGAVEQVWGDGEKAGAREGVDKARMSISHCTTLKERKNNLV